MKTFLTFIAISAVAVLGYFLLSHFSQESYSASDVQSAQAIQGIVSDVTDSTPVVEEIKEPEFVVTHIKTPEPVKAIYMTSWVASTPSIAKKVIEVVDTTEANALVIDIKDYTGNVSFVSGGPRLADEGVEENRIKNINCNSK